jgi:hypothetical protein
MQTKLTNRPVEKVIAAIHALDLEPIKLRVMDPELGEGWTREYAESIERAYRNYLTMLVKHPEDLEDIVVSKEVDEFWHTHILYTMKYTEDCERVFGRYLHHNPHSRERTPAEVEARAASIEKTRSLYQREFSGAQQEEASRDTVKAEKTAYCGAIRGVGNAAYCGAALRAEDAAYCGAALRAEDVAYCGAALRAKDAAYCGAALEAGDTAYCGAALRAKDAAYCGAALRAGDAAYCGAALRAGNAAYCGAALRE